MHAAGPPWLDDSTVPGVPGGARVDGPRSEHDARPAADKEPRRSGAQLASDATRRACGRARASPARRSAGTSQLPAGRLIHRRVLATRSGSGSASERPPGFGGRPAASYSRAPAESASCTRGRWPVGRTSSPSPRLAGSLAHRAPDVVRPSLSGGHLRRLGRRQQQAGSPSPQLCRSRSLARWQLAELRARALPGGAAGRAAPS